MRLALLPLLVLALLGLHGPSARPRHTAAARISANDLLADAITLFPELAKRSLKEAARGLPPGTFGLSADGTRSLENLMAIAYCALPEGTEIPYAIEGETFMLKGHLGYGPEWLNGPCESESCKEWVTACLGGKLNYWGIPVKVIYSSNYPPHQGNGDFSWGDYTIEDGAFFGNFVDGPGFYACQGRSKDPFMNVVRLCAHDPEACRVVKDVGPCTEACEGTFDPGDLTFINCHAEPRGPDGKFPADSHPYHTITMYERPMQFCP